MKIVKVNVDGQIRIESIYDTDNKTSQTVNRNLKVPAGNYKNIVLDFNFISPSANQSGLHLFAVFKAEHLKNPIEVEITSLTAEGNTYNKACFIPAEVLQEKGQVSLGIYGYILNADKSLKKRLSLNPIENMVIEGSYDENAIAETVPEATVFEVYFERVEEVNAQMEARFEEVNNIIAEKIDYDLVKRIEISGASKQETREGYNLVDFSSKGNFENDIFTISGTSNYGYASFDITDILKSNAGKTLYFSCESFDFSNSNKGSVQLLYTKDGTNNYNGVLSNTGVFNPFTIPTDTSNITKALLQVFYNNTNTSGTTYTTKLTKPMLAFEENLPYEQYGVAPSIEHEAPIKSVGDNINLFNIETVTVNKYIDSNNGNTTTSSVTSISDYIEVKANKPYTISYDYETLQNTGNRAICLFDKEKKFLSGTTYVISSTNKKATITPTQDGYMRFSYDNNFTNIKVVQGTSSGAYSPYGQGSIGITMGDGTTSETKALYTQQPFRAIGDVKDCFVKEDSINKERHIIKRHIFNGTETFSKSVSNEMSRYQITFNDINAYTDEARHIEKIICSHFKTSTDNEYGVIFQYKSSIFFIADFATTDEFKAKLTELYNAGTPVYIDYVLATPTLIECTAEQVEVLNDIYSAYGEGMTNIICNDEIEPVIEIVKETKETVQSENDKAISALLARIEALEKALIS